VPKRESVVRSGRGNGAWPAPNELIWVVLAVDAVRRRCVVGRCWPVEATSLEVEVGGGRSCDRGTRLAKVVSR